MGRHFSTSPLVNKVTFGSGAFPGSRLFLFLLLFLFLGDEKEKEEDRRFLPRRSYPFSSARASSYSSSSVSSHIDEYRSMYPFFGPTKPLAFCILREEEDDDDETEDEDEDEALENRVSSFPRTPPPNVPSSSSSSSSSSSLNTPPEFASSRPAKLNVFLLRVLPLFTRESPICHALSRLLNPRLLLLSSFRAASFRANLRRDTGEKRCAEMDANIFLPRRQKKMKQKYTNSKDEKKIRERRCI